MGYHGSWHATEAAPARAVNGGLIGRFGTIDHASSRVTAALFNLFDSKASDIDYFLRSRLRGEPLEGMEDVHFHPTVPRTLRVATVIGF
jgi:hypothetical protein